MAFSTLEFETITSLGTFVARDECERSWKQRGIRVQGQRELWELKEK